jgi:hypothetical protein
VHSSVVLSAKASAPADLCAVPRNDEADVRAQHLVTMQEWRTISSQCKSTLTWLAQCQSTHMVGEVGPAAVVRQHGLRAELGEERGAHAGDGAQDLGRAWARGARLLDERGLGRVVGGERVPAGAGKCSQSVRERGRERETVGARANDRALFRQLRAGART